MHERRFHDGLDRLRAPERLARLEVERVVDLCLEGLPAKFVLDVGCGTGVFAEAFAKHGLEVGGVDATQEMVEAAHGYVPLGHFRQGLAEELSFPDGTFDLVFLGLVLHETDDPLKALKEARRVATRKVAVLEWPYRQDEYKPPLDERLKPETIAKLVRDAGFQSFEKVSFQYVDLYQLKP